MRLRILGSSSKGNCYLLTAKDQTLIIEAGAKLIEVKKALSFRTEDIAGCLISHQHNDHSGYIKEYADAGITILTSPEAIATKELTKYDNRVKPIYPEHGYKLGPYKIIPFNVNHDVTCYGYLINHPEAGNILFLTDTYVCEYTFPDLNQIFIEDNYSDEILENNIINGRLNPSMRPRLLYTHLEHENCKNILRSLDLSQVRNIILLHLSDGNSDAKRFVNEISSEFCINTIAADKEVEIDLNLLPY